MDIDYFGDKNCDNSHFNVCLINTEYIIILDTYYVAVFKTEERKIVEDNG